MIQAIVLAAGESRRMGEPKMLLPWGRSTVLGSVVATLLEGPFASVAVVLGHRAGEHREALHPLAGDPRLRVAVNPRYRDGMLTSVQCGVREVVREGAAGGAWRPADLLIALGDQPLIGAETVERVLAGRQAGPAADRSTALTVPVCRGRRGHPICVGSQLIPALLALPPEAGLRELFRRYPEEVTLVDVPGEEILVDLDTPEEYLRYRKGAVLR